MVSHCSLSDSKLPQVSKTLFSILAKLNNIVVWMVPTCLFLFLCLQLSLPILWRLFQVQESQLVWPSPSFSMDFYFSGNLSLCRFLLFSLRGLLERKNPLFRRFFLFFDNHCVWSSDRYLLFRLYLKIPETFVPLILRDEFLIVNIPLVRMVRFNFFAKLP